jgi:hypothetical protein
MLKKLGLPVMALAALLTFATPKPAAAKVHFGVVVGAPPVYTPYCSAYDPYCSPYAYTYTSPYSPYAYPYSYGYPAPYVYGGWGWHGDHHEHREFRGREFHGRHEFHGRRHDGHRR